MMTIKQFAALCDCNTQTLRYYDKIDLLKPEQVDPWSNYRYYARAQAVDFVKIKNLQCADFTIDEIKVLLTMTDQQVLKVFDRKIAEQTQKLEQMKQIQQSYLTEKSNMERLIHNLSDYLLHAISDFTVLQEFGMSPAEGAAVVDRLKDYIERCMIEKLPAELDVHLTIDGQVIHGTESVADAFASLKDSGYDSEVLLGGENVQEDEGITVENSECIWECHGWQFVYEFIDNIPPLYKDGDYCFFFRLADSKHTESMEFPMFMIAAMLPKVESDTCIMGCCVERSDDGSNHFWLRKKK